MMNEPKNEGSSPPVNVSKIKLHTRTTSSKQKFVKIAKASALKKDKNADVSGLWKIED